MVDQEPEVRECRDRVQEEGEGERDSIHTPGVMGEGITLAPIREEVRRVGEARVVRWWTAIEVEGD